jgi:DNA repair exonuclease SbcCD ATPase subunit
MVINLSLFCQVVLGAGFLFSFIANQSWQSALGGSIVALISGFLGLVVVGRQQLGNQKRIITVLEGNILDLQDYEQQMQESLAQIVYQHQQVESHTRFLQSELGKLQNKIAVQRNYKEQLNNDLLNLDKYNRQIEEDAQKRQTQILQLEKQRMNLEMVVSSLSERKKQVELEVRELEQDVDVIQEFKLQLEAQLNNLESKIQELETPLDSIAPTPYPKPLEIYGSPQAVNTPAKPRPKKKLSPEWQEFVARLTRVEIEILRAIAEQNNPNALIKQIAQSEITMPELLIDGINELALATINDLIIDPGSNPPSIAETEYLQNLQQIFATITHK